ncbi:MAG: PAS domain S-box protein [Bacteroidales bacterium]|nr:PAS domain S-box protein [Bacteroidales bacterium]
MNGYQDPVLIYSSELDLSHLSDFLEPESFLCSFAASAEEFSAKCRDEKFSAIVLAISSNQKLEDPVLNSISWSRNMFTPIMVVTSMLPDHFADQLIRYGFETIMFPFSDREFFFRLRKMIRQKQNEEAVHTNLLSYRTLFDSFPVGIIQTSQKGDFTSVNPTFIEIMGMSDQELYNENFFRMSHPDDYLIMRKQLDRLLRRECRIVKFEMRLINNDGKRNVCKIVAAAIWDGAESFDRFTFVIENIA